MTKRKLHLRKRGSSLSVCALNDRIERPIDCHFFLFFLMRLLVARGVWATMSFAHFFPFFASTYALRSCLPLFAGMATCLPLVTLFPCLHRLWIPSSRSPDPRQTHSMAGWASPRDAGRC